MGHGHPLKIELMPLTFFLKLIEFIKKPLSWVEFPVISSCPIVPVNFKVIESEDVDVR